MKHKKYYLITALLISNTITCLSAAESPFYIGVGSSFKSYKYTINNSGKSRTYFKESIPSIKYSVGYLGGEKFIAQFFGDNIINMGQITPVNPSLSNNTTAKLKRNDYGINISYKITDNLSFLDSSKNTISILGGYRYGTTKISYQATKNNESDKIKTYGPYIGFSYGHKLNEKGDNLVFGVKYNLLSTDFTLNKKNEKIKFNFDGDGYALSLGWKHKLTKKNYLYIAGEYHDFNHDKMKNSSIKTEDFSLKESAYSARVEFIHSFQ